MSFDFTHKFKQKHANSCAKKKEDPAMEPDLFSFYYPSPESLYYGGNWFYFNYIGNWFK